MEVYITLSQYLRKCTKTNGSGPRNGMIASALAGLSLHIICHQHIHGLVPINQITEVTSLKSTISSECMLRRVGVCGIKWLIVIIWPTWSLVTFQLNCTALWIWLSSISCAGETNKWWLGQTRGSLQYCSIHFSKIDIILNQQFEYWFYNNPYLKKEQIIVSTHNNFDQNKLCIQ